MKVKKFEQKVEHGKRVAVKSYAEVFKSMQLLNLCVLYYDFDFDKEMLKKYNESLKAYDNACFEDRGILLKEDERILNEYHISCEEWARKFPTRAKMQMIGFKPKRLSDWDIALQNATESIESCLIMFMHEFTNAIEPTESDIELWWKSMNRYANECYANGMKDDFVIKYFKDQIDLEITE